MLHISMRNVVRLGLTMLVAATALSAPKAQADPIFIVPVTAFTYQDNEGVGTLSLVTDPNAPGPVVPIAVTIEQAGVTLSGAGTRQDVSLTQSAVAFSLREYVGGAPTGPTYLFSGTLFKDANNNVSGGGTYTLEGAPGLVFQWFVHS